MANMLKNLFGSKQSKGAITVSKPLKLSTVGTLATSSQVTEDYLEELSKHKERFVPRVEYGKVWNFAHFGSAEKYYEDAIKRIYLTYPYDGSGKEKLEWHNNSKDFDQYIFDYEYPKTTGYVSFGQQWGTIVEHKDVMFGSAPVTTYSFVSASITVDNSADVGTYSSIGVDSNHKVHISYYDATGDNLMYANNTGTNPTFDTFLLHENQDRGIGSHIAIDSNDKVHISYRYATSAGALNYVNNTGSSWRYYSTDNFLSSETCITTDANNKVYITYCEGTEGLYMINNTGSGAWNNFHPFLLDAGISVGWNSSIALDSNGCIHISYYEDKTKNLRYINNTGSQYKFDIFTLDSAGTTGKFTSLKVDSNNKVHISYYDETNTQLKYVNNTGSLTAHGDALGNTWDTYVLDTDGSVGAYGSLAIDSNDRVHISYYDADNDDLRYINNTGSEFVWDKYTVDSEGDCGRYTGIAVDKTDNNKVHISYYDATNSALKYAYFYNSASSSPGQSYIETIYLSSAPQYITVKGGPNAGIDSDRTKANIYETSSMRSTNLIINGVNGNTVEFWVRKDGLVNHSASISGSYAIFDVWNGKALGSEEYGRFLLEHCEGRNNSSSYAYAGKKFALTYMSGTKGMQRHGICASSSFPVSEYGWHHFAVTCKNVDTDLQYKVYVNGDILTSGTYANGAINEITGAMKMNIGSYLTGSDVSGAFVSNGYGTGLYSFDDFRYWKKARTSKEIAMNWFTNVDGGANTDNYLSGLGVYYKFNEGIVSSGAWDGYTDRTVLDYSGRISNGTYVNYASGSRNTGSAITIYGITPAETADPILYSHHEQVKDYYNEKVASGSNYDATNNASMHNQLPLWILDEDEDAGGHLKNIVQMLASFFDVLFLYIQELPKLRNIDYTEQKEKALAFARKLLRSSGFDAPDIFASAEVIEEMMSRSDDRNFDEKLWNVKNEIYQNIYNNLMYLYKSKGTEKSIRNLIRCFGIDDELIDVNYYIDNMTYTLNEGYKSASTRKKYLDLNHPDRFIGSVYQYTASNSDTIEKSFITASNSSYVSGFTMEASVILPKKFEENSDLYFETSFLTSSLFGYHFAHSDPTDTSFFENDFDCQVLAIKPYLDSLDVKFALSSSTGMYVESPVYRDEYNENRWHLAARLKNQYSESINRAVAGTNGTYIWELYGVKPSLDIMQQEFAITASVSNAVGRAMMTGSKRFYVGACHRNFTGSAVINYSDVEISNARVWLNCLTDEEIKAHARDVDAYGSAHPYRNAYGNETTQNGTYTPNIETLALNWTFDNVVSASGGTGALTSDAQFYVYDISSGSSDRANSNRNGAIAPLIGYRYPGRGDFFLRGDTNVVNTEYVYTAKKSLPETLSESDTVNIYGDYDDEKYTKDQRPFKLFMGIEKSYSRAISKEMLNMFATIVDFNNLIGDPVNRYRQNYKAMEKLRQLFFERVGNTPDIEKYLEFYKWIDSAMMQMIRQLLPASANASDNLGTIIESHVLERNKYWNKYPTLEMKSKDPIGLCDTYQFSGSVSITGSDTIETPRTDNRLFSTSSMIEDDVFLIEEYPRGNFFHNYEVVNVASGRHNNSRYLTSVSGNADDGSSSELYALTTKNDFALPERGKTESIIVSRFAAPGGKENSSRGYLDRASEELSVYNALPWRNLYVRDKFNITSSAHTDLTGTVGFENQNKEKINRNVYMHPVSGGTSIAALGALAVEANYDNAFIQRQIPQSDYQYLWISASSDMGALDHSGSGYFHKDTFANIAVSSSFITYSKQYANLLSASNITNYNYGIELSSWKQTKTAEHSGAVHRRRNNIMGHQEKSIAIGTSDYTEPVIMYNKPIDMKLLVGGQEVVNLTFSYDNMSKYFSNKVLNNKLGLIKAEGSLFGDKILKTISDNPDRYQIIDVRQKKCMFPADINVSLSGSRIRENYDESPGK